MKNAKVAIIALINVATVASIANPNSQFQLENGNIGSGNISTLATFSHSSPMLLNAVHHNPGEERWTTAFNDAQHLKDLGYNGQISKLEVQCGLTMDGFEDGIVPRQTAARRWMEQHAFEFRKNLDLAEKAGVPVYPWIDVLVVPKSLMEKYGGEMRGEDGELSILRPTTERVMRAQLAEFFATYPNAAGVTIRFGETYLHDTPYHCGGSPVHTPEEHARLMDILRDEVCVRRGKTVVYRMWDFHKFHTHPELYLAASDRVEPHERFFVSFKHNNYDYMRTYPMNFNLGRGRHRQIVEISINQGGCYGKNAHPYYIGKGMIDGWRDDVEGPWRNGTNAFKGLKDLNGVPLVAGFWLWTWGDGWCGPYFSNEFWMKLNETVLRRWMRTPERTEEEVFMEYARDDLGLGAEDAAKFRRLCLLSEDAVYYGQHSDVCELNPWWLRDDFITAVDLADVAKDGLLDALFEEKKSNLARWDEIVRLANEIKFANAEDRHFVRVSSEYGRCKYRVAEIALRIQGFLCSASRDAENARELLGEFDDAWAAWERLRAANPDCPTLYRYAYDDFTWSKPLFGESLEKLRKMIN